MSPIMGSLEMIGAFTTPSPATMLDLPLASQIMSRSTMVMPEAKMLIPTPASTCSHLKPTVRVTRTSPITAPERAAKRRPIQALPVT